MVPAQPVTLTVANPSPVGALGDACTAVTEMVFVPFWDHVTGAWFPVVVALEGLAPGPPKVHSYRTMLDVFPDTCARTITVVLHVGAVVDGVTMTDGGWAGRTVSAVDTCSVKPLASVATARTAYDPGSLYVC